MTNRPTDADIETMNRHVIEITKPYGILLTKCLLIGRYCSDVHIVNVAPLNDVKAPFVHEDLNFYAWSSGIPHYTDNFVDLSSNRKILNFDKLGESNRYHADYVVVYYDQSETALYLTYEKHNKALHGFVKKEKMVWHGDLFVAKLARGTADLLDVQESDIEDIKELVKKAMLAAQLF